MSGARTPGAIAPTATQNDWVHRVLGLALATGSAAGAGPAAPARGGLVELQKSRLAWDALRKAIQAQLQKLEATMLDRVRQHNAAQDAADRFDEAEVSAGTRQLYGILDKLDTRLLDALDAALNVEGEARAAHQAQARAIIAEYQGFVAADPLVAAIDSNGFIATSIRPTIEKTLGTLAQRL